MTENNQATNRWIIKGLLVIIGILMTFIIWSVQSWFAYTAMATDVREAIAEKLAEETKRLESRIIVLETTLPQLEWKVKELKDEIRRYHRY
jgi:regulatory protein YycH of two-component signal transduction system YycFG